MPQSRMTSTGLCTEGPCGGTRPTSCSVMHCWPLLAACASAVHTCWRPVSTVTRAPVPTVRKAITCDVHTPPISSTSKGVGRLRPSTDAWPRASCPMTTPSSPTGSASDSNCSGVSSCR